MGRHEAPETPAHADTENRFAPGTNNAFAGGRVCFACLAATRSIACDRCGGAADSPASPRVESAARLVPDEVFSAASRVAAEVAHSRGYTLGRVVWSFPSEDELRRTNMLRPVASESVPDPVARRVRSAGHLIEVGAHFRGTVEMVVCNDRSEG